jgi:hypothetical protein
VTALTEGQRYIKAIIPDIVNIVYKKLLKHDITARIFSTRDSRNEEDPIYWPTEEDILIKHRKMSLRWYLTKLNSDPSKMEYWQYLDKVGMLHAGKGRQSPLHVDYIFLGACLGYIQDSLTDAIFSLPQLELAGKIALVRALSKVIWIQNDLLAKWHIQDGKKHFEGGECDGSQPTTFEPAGLNCDQSMPERRSVDSVDGGSSLSWSSDETRTSLGRRIEQVNRPDELSRCPFTGMLTGRDSMERQRAEAWRRRPDKALALSPP